MINTHQQQQQAFVWRNGVVSLHCSNVSNYINTYYEHFSSCYTICWIIIYTNCIGHWHLPRRKISLLAPGFMRISQLPTMERLRFVCKNASHTHTHNVCKCWTSSSTMAWRCEFGYWYSHVVFEMNDFNHNAIYVRPVQSSRPFATSNSISFSHWMVN